MAAPTLARVIRAWGRIGCLGFGGPPAHIAMLRDLCVERERWLAPAEFEDAIAACNLLPGPASTQLAIFTAWRVRGARGALTGGLAFILPGLVAILALAALFLAAQPPDVVRGAAAGAGAAVAAVAVRAALPLLESGWERSAARSRWLVYAVLGAASAALLGPWLVAVILACGLVEAGWERREEGGGGERGARDGPRRGGLGVIFPPPLALGATGGLGALAWTAFKVGALAYGGGFVIVPLMQADAVDHHHWMTASQFLGAVALGQVTPGPVVHTVAAVGYAAHGIPGGLLAAAVAFAPSFTFVLFGARRFDELRQAPTARAFLNGAGPAAAGAILGSAIPLTTALTELWQAAVLAGAAALLLAKRGVVTALLAAGVAGAVVGLAGGPLP